MFQILQDLHLKQCQETNSDSSRSRASQTSTTDMTCTTTQLMPLMTYSSTPANQNTGMATPITSMSESSTSSRTTMPAETTPSSRQLTSEIYRDTSCNRLSQCCMHVHQPQSQVCKPGESLALTKVKTPHNCKTSVSRFPLTKQDILSQFSGCFEGIGHFPGDPYRFHLKPDHQPARHASKKQGISEEVNEHTDWVHSNIFVEKALEREPYYTHSTGEITKEFPNRERVEHAGHFPTPMEMCMDDHLTQTTERTQQQHLQDKTALLSCPTHNILPDFTFRHAEFPPGMESTPIFPGKQLLQGKRGIHTSRHGKDVNLPREPVPARKRGIHGYRYIYIREHYSEQVPYTQHTHTSGYRARESSTELPATEDGKFQHGGTSMLQLQC